MPLRPLILPTTLLLVLSGCGAGETAATASLQAEQAKQAQQQMEQLKQQVEAANAKTRHDCRNSCRPASNKPSNNQIFLSGYLRFFKPLN